MFTKQFFSPQVGSGSGSWLSGLGGTRSDAGPLVTVESALALTTLQACVTLLAESVAQLPLELFRRMRMVDARRPKIIRYTEFSLTLRTNGRPPSNIARTASLKREQEATQLA